MSLTVVTVRFNNEKSCFVSLSAQIFDKEKKDVLPVFEIEADTGKIYVSSTGDVARQGKEDLLYMNGLFGEKLGLKDGDQLIIRPVSKTTPECRRVSVEPLSVDDWEILDRHTGFIENHLLDVVRVIQAGKIYPIWVEKTVCIFIKIGVTTPTAHCVLLANETQVIVTPKVRSSTIGQPVVEKPISKEVTGDLDVPYLRNPGDMDEVDSFDPKFSSTDSELSLPDLSRKKEHQNDRRIREKSPYDLSGGISGHWRSLFSSILGFGTVSENRVVVSDDEEDYYDEDDYFDKYEASLQQGLNLILRVQYLRYNVTAHDHTGLEIPHRRGSDSPRKGSSSPRKQSRESPGRSSGRNYSQPKTNFKLNYFPQQPSTVYMDMSDVEKQLQCLRSEIPHMFFAKLHKLPSPKDQIQEKINLTSSAGKQAQLKAGKSNYDAKDKASPNSETPDSTPGDLGNNGERSCVVRVIVLDRRRKLCNDSYSCIVKRILEEQPLLKGHVIVPDMLRRFLSLDVTCRVWLQTLKAIPSPTNAFSLYPLGNMPKKVTSEMLQLAFKQWINEVSMEDYPMVVFQGIFLRFQVFPDIYVECQLTYNQSDPTGKGCYTLLHPGTLRNATLAVVSGSRSTDLTHPVIQPMLAYTSIANIDPIVHNTDLSSIGGLDDLIERALCNIEICLNARRLYRDMFLTTPGLLNGMLLLTGPKGSGKTTLAKALCRKMTELPNLAYATYVDCKPLRGKKVDTIQKRFELLFDEAVWRQPSLIFLDDLDHVAGAPAGPEFEMTGEALYAARIAEVVKDLLRKDIRNMSKIAVIASSQSRTSLHPVLVSSRGTHLVQEVLNISPPDKDQRKSILSVLLRTKTALSDDGLAGLNLDLLAQKTEGFVSRDLEKIINRAIHAHLLIQGRGSQDVSRLCQEDFEVALLGFTPASIRNVSLHTAGETGWEDIGGLVQIKETLIETLQWPSKYPALFANCPLRLRSGLLLYGAPGTGKTLLAGAVAKECGLNFISIKGPELLSKYIGASEQAVRDTFVRAQSAKPCILFFDEFDSIAPRRGHDNTGVTDRVVNQLLTQLDGVEGLEGVYVLAATSRPDLIDPALLRPGRLDKCLLCNLPDQEERLSILKALSRKLSLSEDVDFKFFAENCVDFTGADFKALLYNAQLEAIHEFTASVEGDTVTDIARYGMKSAKNRYTSKLKNKKLKLNVETKRERHKSYTSGKVAYIPSLEEGVIQVSAEMEEKLTTQISQIRLRERRTSEQMVIDNLPDSPFQLKQQLLVTQAHLLSAVNKMRPSVSGEERFKFQRIYDNFVSSRGKHFDAGHLEPEMMKATLA